jgi:hypothetical protein
MAEAPEEIVDELYGAPFDEFIARRDAAARELRREKRREEADAVKALRKPSLSAWAVNQLARRDPDRLSGLLAAGAALRAARGGDALRDATHEERGAVAELASVATAVLRDAGHPVSGKTADEVRDTLHAAALDDEARGLIERGRLVEPRQAVGLGGFGFGFGAGEPASASAEGAAPAGDAAAPASAGEAAAQKPSRGARRRKPDKGAGSAAGDGRGKDAAEDGRAAADDGRAAKAAADEKAAAADQRAAKEAEREERARRREAVKAARAALRDAQDTLRELEQEVTGLERALEDAREALDDARAEADRRRAELDDLGG